MDGLELYKAFIDGLVSKKDGVYRKWIIAKKDAPTKNKKFLKGSALVGLGLVDLIMMLTRL